MPTHAHLNPAPFCAVHTALLRSCRVRWRLSRCPAGIKAKKDAIGRFNQQWVDAFSKIGYLDKIHFQGDLVCGYKAGASDRCLNATATMANSWRTTSDIRNNFSAVMKNVMQNDGYHAFGGYVHFYVFLVCFWTSIWIFLQHAPRPDSMWMCCVACTSWFPSCF